MGKQWVGFQTATKPLPGRTVVEQLEFTVASAVDLIALLTTRPGLERWLAPITAFSSRLGGTIDFSDASGTFGGSFTGVDVPHRVVLVTERHGDIAVSLDVRSEPVRFQARVSRFVAEGVDESVQRAVMRAVVERLREECARGR